MPAKGGFGWLKVNSFFNSRYYLPGGRNKVTRPPAPPLIPAATQKA